MKATHDDLVYLVKTLQYDPNDDFLGVCYGYCMAWIYAVLSGDERIFYNRLNLIGEYKKDFKQLLEKINSAREKVKNKILLSREEKKILEIPAFIETVLLHLSPVSYRNVFNRYLNQSDIELIFKLAGPSSLANKELFSEIINHAMVGSKRRLLTYFNNLKCILNKSNSSYPITLGSARHIVAIKYDKKIQSWIYSDINDFSRYPDIKQYYRVLNTEQLVTALFNSLGDGKHLVVNLQFFTNAKDITLEKRLNKLNRMYPFTKNQANIYDARNNSMLLLACQRNLVDNVKEALKNEDIEVNCTAGMLTPLVMACSNGHVEIIELLLQSKNISINQPSADGWLPLSAACYQGHLQVVKVLVEQPNILINEARATSSTPLGFACANGHLEIVKFLLNQPGVLVNKANNLDETPLCKACRYGHLEIVKELLQKGADPYKGPKNYPPIKIAEYYGFVEIAKVIQEKIDKDAFSQINKIGLFREKEKVSTKDILPCLSNAILS